MLSSSQTHHWDSIARRAVEHDKDLAMTTFGPLNSYGISAIANDNRHRRGDYISTYTGRFWPMDPRASEVNIKDIAHSLAMQCRYAGHGRRFYSVAEHSVHLARFVSPQSQLAALLHDATEAYLVDVPRPVKRALAGYKEAEQRVWMAISAAFGLSPILPEEVHEADSRIIADEMAANMHEVDPYYADPIGIDLQYWPPEVAELYFLDMYRKLTAGRVAA